MATTTSDKRVVYVEATRAEVASLIGSKALELGLIDFTPDNVEIFDTGEGFSIVFEVSS